eukprot:1317151-Rhodomonas_salina.2
MPLLSQTLFSVHATCIVSHVADRWTDAGVSKDGGAQQLVRGALRGLCNDQRRGCLPPQPRAHLILIPFSLLAPGLLCSNEWWRGGRTRRSRQWVSPSLCACAVERGG